MKAKGTKNLTFTQRLQLEAALSAGLHKKIIADRLGVCLATVYNELRRGKYEHREKVYDRYYGGVIGYKTKIKYSPNLAEDQYRLNMSAHGAPLKIGNDWDFVRYVEKRVLIDKIAPCAVAGEIKRNRPCRTVVSKATTYRYMGIFMNIRLQDLPFGKRIKRYRKTMVKRPPKGTSIEARPVKIAKRNSYGHWEMDCVIGKQNTRETLLVLTERLTRYEIIMRMPNRKATTIIQSLNKLERRYGKQFRRLFQSITVDNGAEFSDFTGLEKSIYGGRRTKVYYCHPYCASERGTNERLNREIRRHFPKGTDFSKCTDKQIKAVENWVNAYPREIFGFKSSAEMFFEHLAAL